MISLKITNIKQFMGKLLNSDTFDSFLLEEATINTYNTFTIDGHQNKEFYTQEEWEDKTLCPYSLTMWKTIRPLCFDLIKGTHTPTSFRFVLHLIPDYISPILTKGDTDITSDQIRAFALNIKYDGTSLTVVTGTSLTTFIMDKTPDQLWDSTVKQFLAKKEIAFEEL